MNAIALPDVFGGGQNLKVRMGVEPADSIALEWVDMVNMVANACFSRKPLGLNKKSLNSGEVGPGDCGAEKCGPSLCAGNVFACLAAFCLLPCLAEFGNSLLFGLIATLPIIAILFSPGFHPGDFNGMVCVKPCISRGPVFLVVSFAPGLLGDIYARKAPTLKPVFAHFPFCKKTRFFDNATAGTEFHRGILS